MRARYRVYRKISCLVTNKGAPVTSGIRPLEKDLGIISQGAIVFDSKKGILWVGEDKKLPHIFREKKWKHVTCKNLTAYPGLVDCHTHPAFLGDRSKEFSLRMQGATYQQIAESGGGILSSMHATRTGKAQEFINVIKKRFLTSYKFGVRLLEAKSGYGLSHEHELASLRYIKNAADQSNFLQVHATCLAAHAIPPEFRGKRSAYVDKICFSLLPVVKQKNLARYVDVFCDRGYFTINETKRIFLAAQKLGLGLRLHGEELEHTGAAELAAEFNALSVDHLLKINTTGIKKLAASQTIATLLPGTSLYLKEDPAPARRLINAGVRVALATDFNPGSCPTQNLPFIGTLAALNLEMSAAEIITAITWNAAKSLRAEKKYGCLLPGFLGEPIFCEGNHPSALFYKMAAPELPDPFDA